MNLISLHRKVNSIPASVSDLSSINMHKPKKTITSVISFILFYFLRYGIIKKTRDLMTLLNVRVKVL